MICMAAMTEAPPAMSPFMYSMPAAGLMDMPPVSKVIPLPMSPRLLPGFSLVAIIGQDDELGRFVGALRHSHEGPHPPELHIGVVQHLESQPVLFSHLQGCLSHGSGGSWRWPVR